MEANITSHTDNRIDIIDKLETCLRKNEQFIDELFNAYSKCCVMIEDGITSRRLYNIMNITLNLIDLIEHGKVSLERKPISENFELFKISNN